MHGMSPSNLQRRKRQGTDVLTVDVTIGDITVVCGPTDEVCNGPLDPGANYQVRYSVYSGDNIQEYPFFENATLSTGKFTVCL